MVPAGDFNTVPERHLSGASIPRLCPDLLITESTYATSIREDRRSRERQLLNMVGAGWLHVPVNSTSLRGIITMRNCADGWGSHVYHADGHT